MNPLNTNSKPESKLPPLVIGEVLLDQFPDGTSILGGAPFNVAWNLQGFGLNPLFVSAIGNDTQGQQIREPMKRWNMDQRGLQTSKEYPTGTVQVTLDRGQPEYEIVFPTAYDFVAYPSFEVNPESFSILYHGSLAWRGESTRQTIRRLIKESRLPRFVDINIRKPWFQNEWVAELVGGAEFIKLNDEELSELTNKSVSGSDKITEAVQSMRDQYNPNAVYLVTCGARGAYVLTATETIFAPAPTPTQIVDTVGAGDGFAAAMIDGILSNRSFQESLERAVNFAARICAQQGATTTDKQVFS